MKVHLNHLLKLVVFALAILLLISGIINVYQLQSNNKLSAQTKFFKECNVDAGFNDYQLLASDKAWFSVDAFLEKQQHSSTEYSKLENSLSLLLHNAQGNYSLYFEDLNTGAWVSIDGDEEYVPFSLLKVPTLIATLKEIELGRVDLNQKIILKSEDIDNRSGDLWQKGPGYVITVKDLIIDLIKHSDNTAVLTLNRRVISDKTFIESRLAMGLPNPTLNETRLTVKDYSNMLRGLYFSSYLRKPFSELALTIMLETDFNSQIPAGVASNVKVAHKVGFYEFEGLYNDCGIVYAEKSPYILCIMSKNTNSQEADRVISEASKMVYNYVSAKNNATITKN